MIADTIKNRDVYTLLSPRIKTALEYLGTTDFSGMEPGRYNIDGDNIFALIQKYQTIPKEEAKWECHNIYIDIQYIVEGAEQIGFGNTDEMEVITEYDPVNDIAFLIGEGGYATFSEGCYGIFFPHDAHQPRVTPGKVPGQVKKVLIKIKVR